MRLMFMLLIDTKPNQRRRLLAENIVSCNTLPFSITAFGDMDIIDCALDDEVKISLADSHSSDLHDSGFDIAGFLLSLGNKRVEFISVCEIRVSSVHFPPFPVLLVWFRKWFLSCLLGVPLTRLALSFSIFFPSNGSTRTSREAVASDGVFPL